MTLSPQGTSDFPPARLALIVGLIVATIGGNLYCMVRKVEYWPWSDYPMYSRTAQNTTRVMRVVGLSKEREVDLPAWIDFAPFTFHHLSNYFFQAYEQNADLKRPLGSLLHLYDINRQAGKHAGPELVGLRLYRMEWKHDPQLHNLETPERREPICEVYVADLEPGL